jgi:arylsulfatase A-like enzyme
MYYGDTPEKRYWDGYDAIAQTREAQKYIRNHDARKPFVLYLSWGPPHAPYHTAPEKYKAMFPDPEKLWVRPNVPPQQRKEAQKLLAGYYAHIAALDDCMGQIVQTLRESGIEDNTVLVFTADHGDMLLSHGQTKKQKPWDESIRVPFLLRYPQRLGRGGRKIEAPINTPDIMPTLLGLSGIDIPDSCEGRDRSAWLTGAEIPGEQAALIMLPVPFHQWSYARGGREYRGVRTSRYTYVRDLNGPWLLCDNREDPYQLRNLCNEPEHSALQSRLDALLQERLGATNDAFLPGPEYMKMWDYGWDGSDKPGDQPKKAV